MPSRAELELLSGRRYMDLIKLISAPNLAKDTAMTSGSLGTPSTLEKLPLDFANEDLPQMITEMGGTKDQVQEGLSHEIPPVETATTTKVFQEPGLEKEVAGMRPPVNKRHRKRGNDEAEANASPKVLRKDHAAFRPAQSTLVGKSIASMRLEAGSTFFTPATQETPADAKSVNDPEPLSYAKPQPHPERDVSQSSRKMAPEIPTENVATMEVQDLFFMKSPGSEKSTSIISVDGLPGDHMVPPGYFSELCHLPNTDFLSQYNINLARKVAMGSQLRLIFEQEVKLLKRATAKIARRDKRIQVREEEIKKMDQEIKPLRTVEAKVHGLHNQTKNLETLLEAEVDMKKAAEAKNVGLAKELESLRIQFSDLQGSRVIAGTCYMYERSLKHGIEHGKAGRDLAVVEAYNPEVNSKYVKALQDLKDLKYPLVDQLEKFKDALMVLIMESLHLESDFREDALHWIQEMLLEDVIATNISQAKKKKKYMVVCRTHVIGFAHHARSDGILVSVPTIAPRGLAILLADAATQIEVANEEDEPHPRLKLFMSFPPFYKLE
nr:hypothetical protein [Tanacetum cinerariifolium]